jgi:phage shock protein A
MALINRFSRVFVADLHAVLDRIEEPDILLKQAVREMEDALAATRAQAKSLEQELCRIDAHNTETASRLAALEDELEVCFRCGEETLARGLVRRKLELQRNRKLADLKRDGYAQHLLELNAGIAENTRHLAAMKEKLDVLTEVNPPARGFNPHVGAADPEITEADVQIAYLRELQRRTPS